MASEAERREDSVMILLEKVAGADTFQKDITASSPEALVNALAQLIVISARMMGVPELSLVAELTTKLFGGMEGAV